MRYLLACLLLLTGLAAWAEDAFREDFNGVTGWEMQRSWLAPVAKDPQLTATDGIGTFAIAEPNKGMKWLRLLEEPVDLEVAPWLVIRYRVSNYSPTVDYLLYLDDGKRGEGVQLLKGDRIRADGQWHTQAFNLVAEHVTSPVSGIALQCFATAAGNGRLEVDFVALTDLPPADAEGYEAPRPPQQVWPVELKAADWTVQPSWVSNFSAASSCAAAGAGLVFKVPEASRGAKWSRALAQPLTGATWVAMRYRARNLQSWGDYALYIASGGGGKAAAEEYAIRQPELVADGEWHVALGQVTIPTIHTLAVQVQAGRDDASLEIAELRFLDGKPVITLAETFDGTPGWPANMKGWRPLSLPPGNLSGEDLSRRLGAQGWIATGKISSAGVPFTVRDGAGAVNMTPGREPGAVVVPLTGKAAEAYLLLAAQFPAKDEPSYAQSSGLVTHVHRLVARIAYMDGTTEEQFPLAVNSRRHAVSRWLHTYALALEPGKTLRSLALVDGMSQGTFGLVALTLSDRPGPATAATRLRPATPLPAEKPLAARKAGLSHVGDRVIADSWTLTLALDLKPGLRLASLANHSGVGLTAAAQPGPLFRVLGDKFEVTSEQFTVEKVGKETLDHGTAMRLDLRCAAVAPALQATVWVDVNDPREVGLRAKLDLGGHNPATTRFIFPEVRELRFSDRPAETWVWCPRRGDVITAAPVNLREPYAGAGNPFQIIGAFDPRAGTGLYLLTQDLNAVSRFYHVQKTPAGARLGVEYTPLYEPDLPRTVLGCTQGDWHAQLERYRYWAGTWYKAAAPRKRWFREVFSFRQHFLHFGLPTPSGMFDRATNTFRLPEVMAADAEAFGGLDYLHLFDWGWDPVHGRCGDYEPWDYLGGADNFRKAVAGVQDAGTPVGLYLEGILVDPPSNLGQAHGAEWQMLDAAGKPYEYFAPSYHVCSHVPAWQQYLSDTYRRVQQQTGARGFYIDEYGFSSTTYWCYNPAHGHPVPATPVRGERAMLQQVRAKLGPEAAIYTEESPTDVNAQYQDGSFTYNISSVPDDWSPTHVNLYRFAYPDFKTIEIICCDQPLGSNVEAVKRILFNGEAIWIEGIRDKWFTPETRTQIALNRRVMRENRNCFISDHVQALVPTLVEGVYANQFAERPDLVGKTCWTVYNTLYRTVRTEVLAVDHAPGSQYLDEMTGKPLKPRIVGKKAYLTLTLAPRDVVVVSRGLFLK